MSERKGGSKTVNEGEIVEIVEPTKDHPQGNCARDAEGRRRDRPAEDPAAEDAGEVAAE